MTKNKVYQTIIFEYKTIIVAFNNSIIISALAIKKLNIKWFLWFEFLFFKIWLTQNEMFLKIYCMY